jgi:hypothetical protein
LGSLYRRRSRAKARQTTRQSFDIARQYVCQIPFTPRNILPITMGEMLFFRIA